MIIQTQEEWNKWLIQQMGKEFIEQIVHLYTMNKEHMEDILLLYWDQVESYQKIWPQLKEYDIHQLADIMTTGFKVK